MRAASSFYGLLQHACSVLGIRVRLLRHEDPEVTKRNHARPNTRHLTVPPCLAKGVLAIRDICVEAGARAIPCVTDRDQNHTDLLSRSLIKSPDNQESNPISDTPDQDTYETKHSEVVWVEGNAVFNSDAFI